MDTALTRRAFLAGAAALTAGACSSTPQSSAPSHPPIPFTPEGFPLVDWHVHLDELGLEKMAEVSKSKGVLFGIVEHAGTKEHKYPVVLGNDADLQRYIDMLAAKPVLKGIQAEGLDWMTCFSKPAIAKLDYVLTDALTFVERDGRLVNLWKKEQVKIDDPQDFMDRYVEHHLKIIATEPIDILANGTYLPEILQKDFDALWTEKRMSKIVDAAAKHRVAIEISSGFRLPKPNFLRMAKDAGVRFSFGTNARKEAAAGNLAHSIEMARTLGLAKADFFTPAPPGRKPVEVR
jgi:histidinol phosphatase-like PHP family hydrolase